MKSISLSGRTYLLLTLISGFIILLPSLTYQDLLSQTDHGKDLYAFDMTAKGEVPYQNYLWVYGPLMPYYYALFFKLFGASIASVLLGETLLKFACGLTFFAILRQMTAPGWAFISTLFFWSYYPYFFHTYNHTGGIVLILLAVLSLVRYVHTRRTTCLYWGSVAVFLLAFVKLNFGITLWAAYVICVFGIDRAFAVSLKERTTPYGLLLAVLPLLTFIIYLLFTHGLPDYVMKQSFPFSKTGSQYTITATEIPGRIVTLLWLFASSSWRNAGILLSGLVSVISFIFCYSKIEPASKKVITLVLTSLTLFSIVLLHEFLFSGLHYRAIWATVLFYLMSFLMADQVLKICPKYLRIAAMTFVIVLTLNKVDLQFKYTQAHAHPDYFLGGPRGGVLVGNDPQWLQTVSDTTRFMERNLNGNEYFIALPADPLYYFLLDQRSPTYELVFSEFNIVSGAQERQAIQDMEQKKVNWVILSNLGKGADPSFGTFGVSNSALIAKYLGENFHAVAQVGPWDQPAQWISNHGVMILKRNP